MKYLITGLGNPGTEYELTRHNIGFLVLDQLASDFDVSFSTERYAEKAEIKYKGRSLVLIKPNTYMNLSGKAVNYWLQNLKVSKENLLVVVDEIALPHAKLRLKGKGSAGGHNGLGNIEQILGNNQYPRLRFGVGNDFPKGKQVDYVLSNFTQEQLDDLINPIKKACEIILSFATIGIEMTMTNHN